MACQTPALPQRVAQRAVTTVLSILLAFGPASAQVRVSDDLAFGAYSPNRTRWQRAIPVCVWNAKGTGLYRVAISGASSTGFYAMRNSIGDAIPYRVRWYRAGATGQTEQLQPATASRRSYRFVDERTCLEGDTPPHMEITATRRDVDRAPPGNYTDQLSVTIVPL